MLANGKEVRENCHHLRMMKPPEGGVLQLISATSSTDSKATTSRYLKASPSAVPPFTIFCSVKPLPSKIHDPPFSMNDIRRRVYLFELGMAVCPAPYL